VFINGVSTAALLAYAPKTPPPAGVGRPEPAAAPPPASPPGSGTKPGVSGQSLTTATTSVGGGWSRSSVKIANNAALDAVGGLAQAG
jgi:hypothetical protein